MREQDENTAVRQLLWATRIARPVRDLPLSTHFYGEVLGLPVLESFHRHAGYDGVFLGLPGGAELELTQGPSAPLPTSDEDLLVLYVRDHDALRTTTERIAAVAQRVPVANPYWNTWGATFLDPDGYRVVIAASPPVRPPR